MQTYDCHACYVRGNEVDELTKNFKEAYGLLLVRNNVLAESIAELEAALQAKREMVEELEKACTSCYDAQQRGEDRIAELEEMVRVCSTWDEPGIETAKDYISLKAKLDARCNHSELLHEITELSRHNTVLQKADMHREKIWKKRVAKLQAKLDFAEDWIEGISEEEFSAYKVAGEAK